MLFEEPPEKGIETGKQKKSSLKKTSAVRLETPAYFEG